MKIFNELPTAFPWYDKVEKQQHYRENAKISKAYQLISPNDALLPFEVLIESGDVLQATAWVILDLKGNILMDISSNIYQLKGRSVDAGTYIFYNGGQMTANAGGGTVTLSLPPGIYYSQITFGGSVNFYSERFTVPINSFGVNDQAVFINYMKISYTNTCDIAPILYAGNSGNVFTQVMYLDTFVHASEPEIEEDGENDGDQRQIDSFQRMIVSYRFSVAVPDFLKVAITSLQMHSVVNVVTPKGVRTGAISDMTITSSIEDNGAYSRVDVKLEETVMSKHGCCDNMTLSDSSLPINLAAGTNIGRFGYQVPSTANSQIVAVANWTIILMSVTPGVRYYINNWNSTRRELGFYGPGTTNNPTVLTVISSSQITKISGMTGAYTVVAPAGAAYIAFNIKSNTEAATVYENLQIWGANPGIPYLIRAQVLTTTTTNIIAGIPNGSWGNILASSTQTGVYTVVSASLTPAQLIAGVVAPGNLLWWKVQALNYNTDYGSTPAVSRTA